MLRWFIGQNLSHSWKFMWESMTSAYNAVTITPELHVTDRKTGQVSRTETASGEISFPHCILPMLQGSFWGARGSRETGIQEQMGIQEPGSSSQVHPLPLFPPNV